MDMKICVFGIGAVGSILGARLADTFDDVSLVEQGHQLAAIRKDGLRLITPQGDTLCVRPPATDDPAELGPQDLVFLCVKAYSLPDVVDALQPLLGERTRVVVVQNGIPWWFLQGFDGPWKDKSVQCLDPDGRLGAGIPPRRTVGCVTYVASRIVQPGVAHHSLHDRFVVGEPTGPVSGDCRQIADAITQCGLNGRATENIREEVWLKLWGNLAFNPISALTGATMDAMCVDPGTRAVVKEIMGEARDVGRRLGIHFPMDRDTRITNAEALKGFKTSMLQDLEGGRPLEIDTIVGAVAEIARLVGVAVPTIDTVLALVRQRAHIAGCGG
jgi:2-dehydropantoate 2-reductase